MENTRVWALLVLEVKATVRGSPASTTAGEKVTSLVPLISTAREAEAVDRAPSRYWPTASTLK